MASASVLEFMPEPMCLVANTEDAGLVVQEDTVRLLSEIRNPIVVISIVGIYRTGKSFLMNRLMGKNNGFALGATIQSKTKGIWAWCRRHPKQPDWYLLLLDTEGLGDVEKDDDDNDNWIFALSVLLSCTLVYNCQSSLKADAMGKLHYVTRLTELIKLKSNQDEEEEDEGDYLKVFPNFVWVLRDFTLKLEIDGLPVTADQYLRNALKLKEGIGKKVNDYNLPRQCIDGYFREKKCFVLKRPVDNDELFSKLDTLRDEDLQKGFLEGAASFCEYIFTSATPKSVKGRHLSGSMICELLGSFVQTIQSGQIVSMENAVKRMTDTANDKAVKRAVAHYKDKMEKSLQLPVSMDELSKEHEGCFDEAIKIYISESISEEKEEHKKQLEDLLNKELESKCEENKTASKTFCSDLLNRLGKALDQNVADGLYSKMGGNKQYDHDKEKVIKKYQDTKRKGIMDKETLKERQESWKQREALILAADTALTNAERKAVEDKRTYDNERQERLAAEEKIAQQEKILKLKDEDHKKSNEMMQQKMKEDKDKWIEEMEKMKKDLEERKIILEEEKSKQAKENERLISRLEKELDEARKQNEQSGVLKVIKAIGSGVAEGVINRLTGSSKH